MLLAGFAAIVTNKSALDEGVLSYLACEAQGESENCETQRPKFESLSAIYIWIIAYLVLGAYLGVNMLYSVNFGELTSKCRDLVVVIKQGD